MPPELPGSNTKEAYWLKSKWLYRPHDEQSLPISFKFPSVSLMLLLTPEQSSPHLRHSVTSRSSQYILSLGCLKSAEAPR
ncbi:hypothetical protein DSECCO2_475000 [anaerobic digester metagenome]